MVTETRKGLVTYQLVDMGAFWMVVYPNTDNPADGYICETVTDEASARRRFNEVQE